MKFFILRGEELIPSDDFSVKKKPDSLEKVDGISKESEDIIADTPEKTGN